MAGSCSKTPLPQDTFLAQDNIHTEDNLTIRAFILFLYFAILIFIVSAWSLGCQIFEMHCSLSYRMHLKVQALSCFFEARDIFEKLFLMSVNRP